MFWNNTATKQGIFQEIDYLCHTNSSTYSIEDKTRNVNGHYQFVVAEVLDSMDEWDFQGEIATADLVANQQEYTFPTDILTIKRVEVDYDADGVFDPADPFDSGSYRKTIGSSAEINNRFTQNNPKYDSFDMSFFLLPVPDAAVTGGLKIWYTKEFTGFTATAAMNTGQPAFAEPFHRILSLGASLDYARRFGMKDLIAEMERALYGTVVTRKGKTGGLISKMKRFYATRTADKIVRVKSGYYSENYR